MRADEEGSVRAADIELSSFPRHGFGSTASSSSERQSCNVEVIVESKEWGGFGESSSDDTDGSGPVERGVRKWVRDSFENPTSAPHDLAALESNRSGVYQAVRRLHLRFIVFSCVHVLDVSLKICSLVIYYKVGRGLFKVLGTIQLLVMFFSCYVTIKDQDLQQILRKTDSSVRRWLYGTLAFLFFGICQTIQVKRAWSHQAIALDIISDIGEAEGGGWNVRQREHAAHVTFLTGIPFILVNSYAYTTHQPLEMLDGVADWLQLSTAEEWTLFLCNVSGLCLMGFGVVEIDLSVSSFVKARYKQNRDIVSQGLFGILNRLYPLAHVTFRGAEAMMSITEVIVIMIFAGEEYFSTVCVYVFVDYLVAVGLLRYFAASGESWYMHLILGLTFFVTNLAFFIDTQEFAYPAQRVTRYIERWRLLKFVCILGLILTSFCVHAPAFAHLYSVSWKALVLLSVCSAMYYFLLLFLMISKGDDLHTAAMKGDLGRVKQLLQPGPCGEAQDLNARTRDNRLFTAAMLASKEGQTEVLRTLLDHNALVDLRSAQGETCLHLAARRGQVEVIEMLLKEAGAKLLRNVQGEAPIDLALQKRKADAAHCINSICTELGLEMQSSLRQRDQRVSPLRYSTVAPLCAAHELRILFPQAVGQAGLAPSDAKSLSAYIFNQGAGILNQMSNVSSVDSFLEDGRERVPLASLRRVADLGKGCFGKVIEVEEVLRNGTPGRRFAMKLQKKEGSQQQAFSECKVLLRVNHPFIVRLEQAFQTKGFFVLVMELCPSDLNRVLVSEDVCERGLSVEKAAVWGGQVLLGLIHLHEKLHIVYRDMKPDNVLISQTDEAKLTDFGLAKEVLPSVKVSQLTMCGTFGFMAPEVLGSVDLEEGQELDPYKVDVYAYGVTMQMMLLGELGAEKREVKNKGQMLLPMSESTEAILERCLEAGVLSFDAHSLLCDLLHRDPEMRRRLTDPHVHQHPFFLKALKCSNLEEALLMR